MKLLGEGGFVDLLDAETSESLCVLQMAGNVYIAGVSCFFIYSRFSLNEKVIRTMCSGAMLLDVMMCLWC